VSAKGKLHEAEADAKNLARQRWEGSGLTDEQAKKLKLTPLEVDQTAALGPEFAPARSLKIPYFDFEGNTTSFYRIRYLEKLPGFAGLVAKPQRYVQPKGSLNEVYLPPLLPVAWGQIARDTNTAIWITEGEFKAAAACAEGIACIGLGGVDVWRSTKRGITLLPGLQAVEWKQRKIYICFDSDAATNERVIQAQRWLASKLIELGAIPTIVSLPAGEGGAKVGLDDYLLKHTVDDLGRLAADSPGYPEANALWAMNEEVIYVADPGFVYVRGTGQRIAPVSFKDHAYANRHYVELTQTQNGIVAKKKPLAPRWLGWEHRFQLDGITFAPGKERIHGGRLNTWRGWGVEPVEGDVQPWLWLLGFIFKGEEEAREWFERWCAYPLQHPGTKLFTSSVFWGSVHGTGKTLLAYSLMKIYGKNAVEIKNKDLKAGFNEWAENRQLVYGDEITGGERRADADYIKGLITQHEMRINAKYVPTYTLPDCINYIFTSNHPDALFVEDTDRRFFVHEVTGTPAERHFYEAYDRWLKGSGPAHLFHRLLNLDLSTFNPRAEAMQTLSKINMIEDARSDIGSWVAGLRMDVERSLRHLGERAAKSCALFTATQLHFAYDPEGRTRTTINGMARELRRQGFRQTNRGIPVRGKTGLNKLYAVRDSEYWCEQEGKACADHFDSFFGTGSVK